MANHKSYIDKRVYGYMAIKMKVNTRIGEIDIDPLTSKGKTTCPTCGEEIEVSVSSFAIPNGAGSMTYCEEYKCAACEDEAEPLDFDEWCERNGW